MLPMILASGDDPNARCLRMADSTVVQPDPRNMTESPITYPLRIVTIVPEQVGNNPLRHLLVREQVAGHSTRHLLAQEERFLNPIFQLGSGAVGPWMRSANRSTAYAQLTAAIPVTQEQAALQFGTRIANAPDFPRLD